MSGSRYKTTYGTFDMFLNSSIRKELPLYYKPKVIPMANDVAKAVTAFGGFMVNQEQSSGIDSYVPDKHPRGFMKQVRGLHPVLEQLYSILQNMSKRKISTESEESFCNIVKAAFISASKEERDRVFQKENPSTQESKGENKLEFTDRIIKEIITAIREALDRFTADGHRLLIDHEDFFERILSARETEAKARYSLKS
jgi:hypothetical protein